MHKPHGPLLLASLSLCLIAGASTNASADTLARIGLAAPLTGGVAHLGKDVENGARLAVEEINAAGLVVGGDKVTLQLDSQDDAADPRLATQVAQRLVDDGVVAVVGHVTSGTSIPAASIYSRAGIVQITPSSTNPAFTMQGFKTTYRVVGTDAQQGPALATYAAKTLNVKSVAIVDDGTAYGQGLADEFANTAKSLGINIMSRDATTDKATDFRAILTTIKGERPDAIMYGGLDNTGGPFVKQARQLGIRARVLGGDGICTESLAGLAGEAARNVVCSQPSIALERMDGGPAFSAKYEKRFGGPVLLNAPFAYDAVYIIADAMKRAGSTERGPILAAMPLTDYHGIIGETVFDDKGDQKHITVSLFDYKDGKRALLDSVKL